MLLGKIKIHEIAKKLGLTSKEILEVANKLKIDAKSHLSGIEEHEAKAIEDEIMKRKTKNEINKTALIIYLSSLSLLFPKQTSKQYSIK